MNDSNSLPKLPAPPENLVGNAADMWHRIGDELHQKNNLTKDTLKKLTDLCFWEQQKSEVMEHLKEETSASAPAAEKGKIGKSITSVHLSNLKAIQKEMDRIRKMLGLTPKSADEISQTPVIPDVVYQNLPELAGSSCSLIEDQRRKDLFLTTSLPVIASHLINVQAEHANGYYSTDLYVFMVEGSGIAKRMAKKSAGLGKTLHHKRISSSVSNPQSLFLPRIDGVQSVFRSLEENSGKGLLFETELDTLVDGEENGWRSLSYAMRKAFHNEEIFTKWKGRQIFLKKPALSVCFTGNTTQFKEILKNSEHDHFSLYALYSYDAPLEWQSHRPQKYDRQLNEQVAEVSEELNNLHSILSGREEPLVLRLSDSQWQMIDDTFAEKMQIIEELDLSESLHASNTNAAILALRLASVFSVLRVCETDPGSLSEMHGLQPADSDIVAALWLADTYIKHAIRLVQMLPETDEEEPDAKGERYNRFYEILPVTFKTAESVEIADKLEIPNRTAKRYLNQLVRDKKIKRTRRGVYKKTEAG